MVTSFNIYYSTNANGPWTLVNNTPIPREDGVMSYFISGLDPRTKYYIQIIGGYVDDNGNFVELRSQHVGPSNIGANISTAAPPSIEVVTVSPLISGVDSGLSHIFTISDFIETFSDDDLRSYLDTSVWNRSTMHPDNI